MRKLTIASKPRALRFGSQSGAFFGELLLDPVQRAFSTYDIVIGDFVPVVSWESR